MIDAYMKSGAKVLIHAGNNDGKFGEFIGYVRDSGYLVPEVKLATGEFVKPWPEEVISRDQVKQQYIDAKLKLEKATEMLRRWNDLERADI